MILSAPRELPEELKAAVRGLAISSPCEPFSKLWLVLRRHADGWSCRDSSHYHAAAQPSWLDLVNRQIPAAFFSIDREDKVEDIQLWLPSEATDHG